MASVAKKRRYAPRLPPAERREQLLDAALEIIARDGYGGVSMEAIARVAGVTKPVVYDLYANRGELLMALLEREEARALGLLAEVTSGERAEDPEALLTDGLRAFLVSVAENPNTWRLIVLPADSTPAVVREHVERGRGAIRTRMEELLAAAAKNRGLPVPEDLELAARANVALAEEFARLVLTDPARYSPERIAKFVESVSAAWVRRGR